MPISKKPYPIERILATATYLTAGGVGFVWLIIAIIIWVLFVVDNAVSFKVISGFTRVAKIIKKDSTEEITKKVKEILTKQGYLYRRLVSAFNFQASEKLIQNIKDRVVNETKKVISNGINKTNEAKNKIIAGSKEKINELKSKTKKNKKIK